ncbi:MAG: hypothetical protein K9K40_13705 [Desulfotignum sp.]|nr:hypothetical protein [Desulfotignum sp.]
MPTHYKIFKRGHPKKPRLCKELIENTTTRTGLKVKVQIIKKIYQTGRKYADNFKKTMRILFDDYLDQWNSRAIPIKT